MILLTLYSLFRKKELKKWHLGKGEFRCRAAVSRCCGHTQMCTQVNGYLRFP